MFGIGMPELIIIAVILAVIVSVVIIIIFLTGATEVKKRIRKGGVMFCTKCGKQNEENAFRCVECGNVLQKPQDFAVGTAAGTTVKNYLVPAILLTIFCCLPFGIPAIVFAAQVNTRLELGDHAGAVETSKKAKKWCWVAFGVGLGIWVLYLLVMIIAAAAGR